MSTIYLYCEHCEYVYEPDECDGELELCLVCEAPVCPDCRQEVTAAGDVRCRYCHENESDQA